MFNIIKNIFPLYSSIEYNELYLLYKETNGNYLSISEDYAKLCFSFSELIKENKELKKILNEKKDF